MAFLTPIFFFIFSNKILKILIPIFVLLQFVYHNSCIFCTTNFPFLYAKIFTLFLTPKFWLFYHQNFVIFNTKNLTFFNTGILSCQKNYTISEEDLGNFSIKLIIERSVRIRKRERRLRNTKDKKESKRKGNRSNRLKSELKG